MGDWTNGLWTTDYFPGVKRGKLVIATWGNSVDGSQNYDAESRKPDAKACVLGRPRVYRVLRQHNWPVVIEVRPVGVCGWAATWLGEKKWLQGAQLSGMTECFISWSGWRLLGSRHLSKLIKSHIENGYMVYVNRISIELIYKIHNKKHEEKRIHFRHHG